MTPSQRRRLSKTHLNAHDLTATTTGVTQPRQSPVTDIRTLTRLVFECYQASYPHSSPKVQRRYQRLIHSLTEHGRHDHEPPTFKDDGCR